MNFNNPLPAEIEATMPSYYVSSVDKSEWRRATFLKLHSQGILDEDENGNAVMCKQTVESQSVQTNVDSEVNTDEKSEDETETETETDDVSDDVDTVDNSDSSLLSQDAVLNKLLSLHKNDESDLSEKYYSEQNNEEYFLKKEKNVKNTDSVIVSQNSQKVKSVNKHINKKQVVSVDKDDDTESIKYVSKSVMTAVRRVFPDSASKADLISAVVYLFTNGDCEISDRAMELVNSYKASDSLVSLKDEIKHLRQDVKRIEDLAYSIELCTCYNAFDRRYGSDEKRTEPKNTEFREKGNLDMLDKLRQQAKDQKEIDRLKRGREMYASMKDKND